jgi:hypothetical protein
VTILPLVWVLGNDPVSELKEKSMQTLTYKPQDIKYITDTKGKRQEVVVPFNVWKSIIEELEALREKQQILLGLQQACREVKQQEKGELAEEEWHTDRTDLS